MLTIMACEDKNGEDGALTGTWKQTNMGTYANENCSGALDYSNWASMVAFGFKNEMTFKSDGTGTFTSTGGGETDEFPFTWDESKSQICAMGECFTYTLVGDKFTIDQANDANCEDDNGEESGHTSKTTCEAAGNWWTEAVCYQMEFTKD
jgi:hypothetical protein